MSPERSVTSDTYRPQRKPAPHALRDNERPTRPYRQDHLSVRENLQNLSKTTQRNTMKDLNIRGARILVERLQARGVDATIGHHKTNGRVHTQVHIRREFNPSFTIGSMPPRNRVNARWLADRLATDETEATDA